MFVTIDDFKEHFVKYLIPFDNYIIWFNHQLPTETQAGWIEVTLDIPLTDKDFEDIDYSNDDYQDILENLLNPLARMGYTETSCEVTSVDESELHGVIHFVKAPKFAVD